MNADYIYEYYTNSLLPVYSRVTSEKLRKPTQVGIEIENAFSHLSVHHYFKKISDHQNANEHVKKALGHLERAVLDCYKILWIELSEQAAIFNKPGILEHATNSDLDKAISLFEEFKYLAKEARKKEIENLNEDPQIRISFYQLAVKKADELYKLLDMKKVRSLNKMTISYFVKTNAASYILGIITGVAGNFVTDWIKSSIISKTP